MKRLLAVLVLVMLVFSSGSVLAFNPDEADGMNFDEMRAQFGKVPYNGDSLKLGAVAKAFENEY